MIIYDRCTPVLQRPIESALRPCVAVVDQLAVLVAVAFAVALPQAHLDGGQDEFGVFGGGCGPADDAAGEGVDDEGDVDRAGPGCDVGEVRDPGPVRRLGDEVAVDQVRGAFGGPVLDGGDDLPAADSAGDAEFAHQPLDGAAGDLVALPAQVVPDLAGPVDAVVGLEHLLDQDFSSASRTARAEGGRALAA
jgi:hypothetical protein